MILNFKEIKSVNEFCLDLFHCFNSSYFSQNAPSVGESWGIIERELPRPQSAENQEKSGTGKLQGAYPLDKDWRGEGDDSTIGTNAELFKSQNNSKIKSRLFDKTQPLEAMDDDISIDSVDGHDRTGTDASGSNFAFSARASVGTSLAGPA
jgi:hypothetical protein